MLNQLPRTTSATFLNTQHKLTSAKGIKMKKKKKKEGHLQLVAFQGRIVEQVEALTVLDSEIYVGNFSENLNHDFVVQSDSIMQGGVSLGILHMETEPNTGYQPQKLQGKPPVSC